MIKLLVTDLDGTIIRQDGTISERVLSAFANCRAAGITLCVATGRVRQSVPDIGQAYTICHGGTIVLEGERLLHRRALSVAQSRQAWLWAESAGVPGVFYGDDRWSANYQDEQIERLTRFLKTAPGAEPDYEVPLARLRRPAVELAPAFPELHLEEEGDWTYLRSVAADKGTGLRLLMAHLGLAPDEVACFGDEMNDLPMFPLASHRVAVGNARPELQAIATHVVPSVAEDGVAVWLEQFALRPQDERVTL